MEITQKIANLSISGIPSDFKLEPQMGPIRPIHLPDKAYYYSAIRAVEALALDNWDGHMEKRDFETTKYPQLSIMVYTRHGSIPRKYVIWGLILSCGLMDKVTGFGTVFFDMQWKGREVGGIAFTLFRIPQPPHLSSDIPSNVTKETQQDRVVSSDYRNLTYSTALSGQGTSQTDLKVPSNADTVSAAFLRHGGPLREADIYMIILMALVQAGEKPNHLRITDFWHSDFEDYHTEIYTNQQPPSRSQRPYYTFGVLIRSLGLYAQYFVEENQNYETGMMTMIDGVTVATTLLRHVRHERTAPDQGEVSTS